LAPGTLAGRQHWLRFRTKGHQTMRFRALIGLAATAAAGLMATGAQAQVVQIGTLTCDVAPGVGMIVASRKEVACTFQNAAGELETYDGAISKLGVDIGVTEGAGIVWAVFAPSGNTVRGALSGNYVGGTAQATFGVGVGANALIGGFRRSVTLQPLSLSGQTGVNVAAGVAELHLELRPERVERRRRQR
jgi:hypothetical protein